MYVMYLPTWNKCSSIISVLLLIKQFIQLHFQHYLHYTCASLSIARFSSYDEENVQFCCENIAANVEHTLEWEREMVIKRQQEVIGIKMSSSTTCTCIHT